MNDCPLSPSRSLKAYAAAARLALWLLLSAWLVLVLAWGALHAFIVPRIGELRPWVEAQAGRALGVPVRIGSIAARSEGFVPSFELDDVVLLDAGGRAALRLPRVLAALSPRSLWNRGFEQLYIDRPELDVRRTADGHIHIAGLDFSRPGASDEGRAADWFFSQAEFVIRQGTLRWTDETRSAPPLELAAVDLVVRNRARRHDVRLDATPPPAWGDRFSVRGMFRQPLLSVHDGRWQDWDGQMHGDFTRIDVSQLRRYANVGARVLEGRGAVRAWADVVRGQVVGGTADLVLADVTAQLGTGLEPLALASLSGRIGGHRLDGAFDFETKGLQFVTRDGQRWPGGNLAVRWSDAGGTHPARGELHADRLDLRALAGVAERLPLGRATHDALVAYAPHGLVEAVDARWQGPLDDPGSYEARGRVTGLEIAAQPASAASAARAQAGVPGVRGANVDFDFSQSGGRARLQMRNGALSFPGVFEEPSIALDDVAAQLQWKRDGNAISVSATGVKFANADAKGDAEVRWQTGAGAHRFPGVLDLQGSIAHANGTRVWRYLPLAVPKEARNYVREAVTAGTAHGGKFRVRGDLRDFPFRDAGKGDFRITADVQDATFAYVPRSIAREGLPWPGLTHLDGQLVFERNGMQVRNAVGRFVGAAGLDVKADAEIPDFWNTVVHVGADVRGPLNDALGIVNGSPVGGLLSGALAKSTATGSATVHLKLELPVATIDRSKVQGSVELAGNDVQITLDTPLLAKARGTVSFNERGFTIAGAQAHALGGDVRVDGGTRPVSPALAKSGQEPTVVIRAQGTATAEGLRQARELGPVARLARDATGSAPYAVTLAFRRGLPEVVVTSSLQGLALGLPAPMGKAADTPLPLRYENTLARESFAPGATLQDQLSLSFGQVASMRYVRDVSGAEPRVLRGVIAVGLPPGETPSLPDQGVLANVNLASVNLDSWSALLDSGSAASGTPVARGAPAASPASAGASVYLPTALAVRARELVAQGRSLHNVVVGGSRDGNTLRANIHADELDGYAEYRPASPPATARLYARLARLSLGAAATKEVESLLDEQPTSLPALDVVVDDFDLRGKKLGRLEIDAVNRPGAQREWRLNKLNLTMAEAQFSANGNWAVAGGSGVGAASERTRTDMRFRLDIGDSGLLLGRFGMKDVVRRGRGRLEGQVAWMGSPLAFNYASMDGAFNINMESGQFLKADPGIAKLLGVMSLQALPRRLALDFRDVFSEGFAFDFVRGDVTIADGIASTNNLQMKGVNAAVLMEGRADIAKETQDLKVVVVPEINAGTASLVATVINPAIGVGTFLAQLALHQPLMRAITQEFHIDGTWTDPHVTRVGRHFTGPAGTPPADASRQTGSN